MSFTREKLSQQGVAADVTAGDRIRIDPLLRDAEGNIVPPKIVNLEPGWAFQLMLINETTGVFEVQNVTAEVQTLEWFAEYPHSIQWQQDLSDITAFTVIAGEENIAWQANDPCFLAHDSKQDDVDPILLTDADLACQLLTSDSSGADQNLLLPPITADNDGIIARIKRRGDNTVTITPTGAGELIDDQANYVLALDQESVSLVAILLDPITALPCWRAF